tara:strand:- start:2807 stop:2938 length:132 start_codon:yes stop_codon:yes gene_type:complete
LTRREARALNKYLSDEQLDHFDKQAIQRAKMKVLNGELHEIQK